MKRWSHPPGLNRRPADYESAALPTELGWPVSAIVQHPRQTAPKHCQRSLPGWNSFSILTDVRNSSTDCGELRPNGHASIE